MKDITVLPSGIPRWSQYEAVKRGALVSEMEVFSSGFLASNSAYLSSYCWSRDPLHHWSRLWEYPYTFLAIKRQIGLANKMNGSCRILDAGSGVTFFPYFLSHSLNCSVDCLDNDASLGTMYDMIGRFGGVKPAFHSAELSSMPFEDESFDMVYCVSVIEHTTKRQEILNELGRVLKHQGILVLTFDISLDGSSELSIEETTLLLTALHSTFNQTGIYSKLASTPDSREYLLNTMHRFPWRSVFQIIRLNEKPLSRSPLLKANPLLTVWCDTFKKLIDRG